MIFKKFYFNSPFVNDIDTSKIFLHLIILFNFFDIIITFIVIEYFNGIEGNHLFSYIINNFGIYNAMIIKFFGMMYFVFIFNMRIKSRIHRLIIFIILYLYIWILINNIVIIWFI